MPPTGDGFYYFSSYLFVRVGKSGSFNIQINGEVLCTAETVHTTSNNGPVVCGGASYIMEGVYNDITSN